MPTRSVSLMNCLLVTTDLVLSILLKSEFKRQGAAVHAVQAWKDARTELLLDDVHPDVLMLDLERQLEPATALEVLARQLSPDRILVLTGAAALAVAELRALGFPHVLSRPCSIESVIAALRRIATKEPKESA